MMGEHVVPPHRRADFARAVLRAVLLESEEAVRTMPQRDFGMLCERLFALAPSPQEDEDDDDSDDDVAVALADGWREVLTSAPRRTGPRANGAMPVVSERALPVVEELLSACVGGTRAEARRTIQNGFRRFLPFAISETKRFTLATAYSLDAFLRFQRHS